MNYPLCALFVECNRDVDYTTVTQDGCEVDYKFLELDDTLVICFEPSDSKIDWKINFSYWRKPYKDMGISYRVHGGFLKSFKLVRDDIRAKVLEPQENGYRWKNIIVVGYSHGGALSALCHELVWFERPDLREEGLVGLNFEGPRVFAGFRIPKALKERWAHFYTFRNHADLVTHMPPILFGFRHVGEMKKIKDNVGVGLVHAHYQRRILISLKKFEEAGGIRIPSAVENGLKCGLTDILLEIDRAGDKK